MNFYTRAIAWTLLGNFSEPNLIFAWPLLLFSHSYYRHLYQPVFYEWFIIISSNKQLWMARLIDSISSSAYFGNLMCIFFQYLRNRPHSCSQTHSPPASYPRPMQSPRASNPSSWTFHRLLPRFPPKRDSRCLRGALDCDAASPPSRPRVPLPRQMPPICLLTHSFGQPSPYA